jgi:hypothetical protein
VALLANLGVSVALVPVVGLRGAALAFTIVERNLNPAPKLT